MLRALLLFSLLAMGFSHSQSFAGGINDQVRPIFDNIEKVYIPLPIYEFAEQVTSDMGGISHAEFQLILDRLKADLLDLPELKPQNAHSFAEIELLIQIVFARADKDFFSDIKAVRNLVGRKLYYLPEYVMWSYKLDWILAKFERQSLPSKQYIPRSDGELIVVESIQLRRRLETLDNYIQKAGTYISDPQNFARSIETQDMNIEKTNSQYAAIGDSKILIPAYIANVLARAECSNLFVTAL